MCRLALIEKESSVTSFRIFEMATGSDLIEMPSGREGTQANNNGITT